MTNQIPKLLRNLLIQHFDEGELMTLCHDLGVDYEDLPRGGKGNKVTDLISYMDRRGRIKELIAEVLEARPFIETSLLTNASDLEKNTEVTKDDPFSAYLTQLREELQELIDRLVLVRLNLRNKDELGQLSILHRSQSLKNTLTRYLSSNKLLNQHEFANLSEAVKYYDGRLLLLGEPGAGKTVTLWLHMLDAIDKRLSNHLAPLPIFAEIASWNESSLKEWIAKESRLEISKLESELAQENLLLLLDGLDELGISGQLNEVNYEKCVRFIQLVEDEFPTRNQVIISCRSTDYEAISRKQKVYLNGVVRLLPITEKQVKEYLTGRPNVWQIIENNISIIEIVQTPFMLNLFAFAFRHADDPVRELGGLSQAELRDVIFKQFVQEVYEDEQRSTDSSLQIPIDVILDKLGSIALHNVGESFAPDNIIFLNESSNSQKITDNQNTTISQYVGNSQLEIFIKIVTDLNLLKKQPGGTFSFLHLLLRDYFAYSKAFSAILSGDGTIRRQAVDVMGKLGDQRAVPLLLNALKDLEITVRFSATQALSRIGSSDAVEPLIEHLKVEEEEFVRFGIINALGDLQDTRAVSTVKKFLKDPDDDIRLATVEALSKLAEPSVIPELIKLNSDPNDEIRRQANYSIIVLSANRG